MAELTPEQSYNRERMMASRHLVPPHMFDAIDNYIVHRIRPGSFLTALLSNDLMGAVGRADDVNRDGIVDWCAFLYNCIPSASYGSPAAVDSWLAAEQSA